MAKWGIYSTSVKKCCNLELKDNKFDAFWPIYDKNMIFGPKMSNFHIKWPKYGNSWPGESLTLFMLQFLLVPL